MRFIALVIGLSAGCRYTSAAYVQDVARASCDIVLQCTDWYPASEQCLAATVHEDTRGCDYDPEAARACVGQLRSASCPGEGLLPPEPDACRRVWTGCDGLQTRSGS